MTTGPSKLKSLRSIKRQSVRVSQESLVTTRLVQEGHRMLLVEPSAEHLDVTAWAADNRGWIEERLLEHGGLLLRGFAVPDSAAFQQLARAITPELLDYVERAAPRKQVVGQVFTSTESSLFSR